jgi:acetyltransferase
MSVVDELRPFMEPRSVALIGVPKSTTSGVNTVEFMLEYGYKGRIYPVNPSATEIVGLKAYANVKDVPEHVDLAVISVPRQIVPSVLGDCIEKGIKAVIVVSQGFADADQEGKALQGQIVAMARPAGVRIVGPNSMGTINAFQDFCSAFVHISRPTVKFPVGFASQSGICVNLGLLGSQVGGHRFLGKAFDLGNTCDVDFADVLEYFEADPEIKVIALHMEGVGDGRRFLEVASRVSRRKPIVVVKAGRTEQGARAVASHTGALVGQDEVYEAAFQRAGLVRAKNIEELEDMVKAFFTLPPLLGNRIGMVTLVGAFGVMAVDAAAEFGLEMAPISEATVKKLEPAFPAWLPVTNPIDIWPASYVKSYQDIYREALEAVLEDPGIDAALCLVWLPILPRFEYFDVCPAIQELAARYPQKPVISFAYGPCRETGASQLEASRRVPTYPSVERALAALGALWRYSQYQHRADQASPTLPVRRDRAQALLEAAARSGRGRLDAEGFDLLAAYGIEVAPSRVAGSEEEVLAAAQALGYPVALKVLSPQVSHKSDVGGVRLGIEGPEMLRAAYRAMLEQVQAAAPGVPIEGVLVQRMVSGGVEVILGVKRDPQFGPVVIFGGGGLYAEVMKDIAYGLAPLSREQAEALVRNTKVYQILQGIRGTPRDVQAVVEALVRLSQLAADCSEVSELDINPMMVLEQGCVAADVRVVL